MGVDGTGVCGVVGVVSKLGGVSVEGGSTFFLPSHLLRRLVWRSKNIFLTCLETGAMKVTCKD